MTHWRDKVVLVTGGSAGFGLAIAQAFASQGAALVVVGRSAEKLAEARAQLTAGGAAQVETQCCDVTRHEEVVALESYVTRRFQRLDVLVNNAGISTRGRVLETPLEQFRELWEINFLAAVRCTQLFARHLIGARGHLVNIGSLASKTASANLGAYPSSKFPLAAFSQQVRLEAGPQGLHVLLVCPGPIQRPDAGNRYDGVAQNLSEAARKPGGGVKLGRINPQWLAQRVVSCCERRKPELVVPGYTRFLFAISSLCPSLGDWIIRKKTSS